MTGRHPHGGTAQEVVRATIDTWAAAGDPVFASLRQEGRVTDIDNDNAYASLHATSGSRSYADDDHSGAHQAVHGSHRP